MTADCHIHMVLDGYDWKSAIGRHANKPDDDYIRAQLETYRRLGLTWLRDGGDRWGVGARARELAADYGITYRTPLAPLCQAGHYGSFIGLAFENLKEYAALVQKQKKQGADFIKIMISGLMDFHRYGVLTEESPDLAQIKEMVYIAHCEGMAVMAHCNGGKAALAAAEMGLDSLEHGAYLSDEAMCAMAEFGTVWVPTLSTVGNLLHKGRFPDDQVQRILEDTLEKLASFKGFVAPGTDAGAWAVPHGSLTEADWLARAGIGEDQLADGITILKRKF